MIPHPAPSVSILGFSFASLLGASALGIPVSTVAVGMLFSITGLFGRMAFDLQKSLETGNKLRLIQTVGWAGAGLLGAPFVTVAWVVFLRAIGAQTDLTTAFGLLFLGFSGSKGMGALVAALQNLLRRFLPESKP